MICNSRDTLTSYGTSHPPSRGVSTPKRASLRKSKCDDHQTQHLTHQSVSPLPRMVTGLAGIEYNEYNPPYIVVGYRV